MTTQLENKAMIVKLNTSMWSAGKSDRSLARTLTDQFDAQDGSARVRKQLVNREALKPLKAAMDTVKSIHNRVTLPWSDNGERLLPVEVHSRYKQAIEAAIDVVDEERRKFLDQYQSLIEGAQRDLGQMFDERDYPQVEELRAKFGATYEVLPVPAAKHFVADLSDREAQRIKADMERRNKAKLDAAIVGLYERIEDAINRMIERLGKDDEGKPRRIHESALDSLREIAATAPDLNMTDDPRIIEIANRIEQVMTGIDVQELRYKSRKPSKVAEVDTKRKDLSTDLESIARMYFVPSNEAGN